MKFIKLLAEKLTICAEKVTPAAGIVKDLGEDSLDVVEMLMSLEEEFGITVDEDKAATIRTVADVVALIENN